MPHPRITLCLEQTLGHRAHGQNLESVLDGRPEPIDVVRVEYPEVARVRVPWAVRGSIGALRGLRASGNADVALFHTQTISLFAPLARTPYVVSVDATPVQVDAMGRWYAHRRGPHMAEEAKRRWYARVFRGAAGVVAWSEWAADSLVVDYGVGRDRILVAHPGAPQAFFDIDRARPVSRLPRILFVGGDFRRKGGEGLLAAFRGLEGRAELVLVTEAAVHPEPGVRVLRGVRPGSEAQLRAYADADIFCLPTLGDCTPVALGEAMAAGLPVVTTSVGSNHETVRDGEHGFVVAPGDVGALREALSRLVDDAALRQAMGAAARSRAHDRMDAGKNAHRVLDYVGAVVR
ncbi:MAG: glycosyltransferase family 4 protein [Dehalococcoidia bacterium]